MMTTQWPPNLAQDGITRRFPVNGQGTLIYTKEGEENIGIIITPDRIHSSLTPGKAPDSFIALLVKPGQAQFVMRESAEKDFILLKSTPEKRRKKKVNDEESTFEFGTEKNLLVSYWFSYDRDTCVLKYGKGYRMVETTILKYNFKTEYKIGKRDEKTALLKKFFNASSKKYVIAMLDKNALNKVGKIKPKVNDPVTRIDAEDTFEFDPNPLVGNYSPIIMDSSKITLFDLDRNQYMFSASLPGAAKELYENIKNIELEYPRDPITPLTDAIRYSLDTPGKHLHKILKEKEKNGEFPSGEEVYIRVTCGPEQASGPGIPYVLEIWPRQCKSPIHNHGGACAVIKVLHGQIQITIYNKDTNPPDSAYEITKFDATEGNFTWMGPNWYQRHELKNVTNDYCATIQCYQYDQGDKVHWPGFDFVEYDEEENDTDHDTFFPNSDGNFQNMRSIVLKEYRDFLEGNTINPEKSLISTVCKY